MMERTTTVIAQADVERQLEICDRIAQMTAQHPELTAEECRALHWCYNHLIIQGSGGKLRTVMDSDPVLTRYDMARVIYHFWLYVLQGS